MISQKRYLPFTTTKEEAIEKMVKFIKRKIKKIKPGLQEVSVLQEYVAATYHWP